jgi:hypothetical protein
VLDRDRIRASYWREERDHREVAASLPRPHALLQHGRVRIEPKLAALNREGPLESDHG